MKTLLFTLAATALAGVAAAQGIGIAEALAESHLTGPDGYRIADVEKAPNGDYVFLLDVTDSSGDTAMGFIRTTPNGAVVWTRTFPRPGAPGGQFCHKLAIALDGKVYAVSSIEGTNDQRDYYFISLNGFGLKLNERVVDQFDNDNQVGDLQTAPDGSVYFSGGGLDANQPLLVRMNANLVTDWAYALGNTGAATVQHAGELDVATDSSVVASATYDTGPDNDCQFVRLDSAGTVQYTKFLGDANNNDAQPKVLLGSDGMTYFTYTRSQFTASEQARLSQYDAGGTFQWNMQEAGFKDSRFVEAPGGTFVFAEVQNASPFSLKVFRFDTAGTVLWSKTLTRTNMDSHATTELAVDDSGYITVASFGSFTGKVGGDMLLSGLSSQGAHLYDWGYDMGASYFDVPAGLVTASFGEVVYTGSTTNSGVEDAHTFQLKPILLVQASNYLLRLGRRDSGNLDSTFSDDNDYLRLCKFIVPNQSAAPINIEFDATVPADYPIRSLSFDTVVKANTVGLQHDAQLWNYLSNSWDASVLTGITLSEQRTSVVGQPDPHVEGLTRNVKARVRVRQVGPVTLSIWCVDLDLVGWRITP